MEKHTLEAPSGNSDIFIGPALENVSSFIDMSRTIIITDSNVSSLYGRNFPDAPVITLEPGEKSKSFEVVNKIVGEMIGIGADRSWMILGIGGGVVTDIAGFVSSIYMRGIRFGFVSTTLLAQVDAGIGGKNGINISGIKNLAGTIVQPSFVMCDTEMLKTLSEVEYLSGLGEVVKYALIRDIQMLGFIEENIDKIMARDRETLSYLISASVRIKSEIVEQDEREGGQRRILNFGHTIGHAIEASARLPHGIAVAHGMLLASEVSFDEGLLDISGLGRIRTLLERLGLLQQFTTARGEIARFILSDKKREGGMLNFICLRKPGEAMVVTKETSWITEMLTAKGY